MGKMVRFLLVLSLSGMAAAQDIAPPAVPDLNGDTEEGGVREKNREGIRNFLAQLCLVRNLPAFEVIIRGGNGLATEFYQVILEEFSESALKRCPADFQELIVAKKNGRYRNSWTERKGALSGLMRRMKKSLPCCSSTA